MSDADFRWVSTGRKYPGGLLATYVSGAGLAVVGVVAVVDQVGTVVGSRLAGSGGPPQIVPRQSAGLEVAEGRAGGVLAAVERWSRRQASGEETVAPRNHYPQQRARHRQEIGAERRPAEAPARPALLNGLYRTVCVRLCDGAYFPISFSTTPDRFAVDSAACANRCGSPARLYVYPVRNGSVATMTTTGGEPYGNLQTAFRFRALLTPSCSCKPEPWSQAALARHRAFAGEAGPAAVAIAAQAERPQQVAHSDRLHGAGMLNTLEVPPAEERMTIARYAGPLRPAEVIFDATGMPAPPHRPHPRPVVVSIIAHVAPDASAQPDASVLGRGEVAALQPSQPETAAAEVAPPLGRLGGRDAMLSAAAGAQHRPETLRPDSALKAARTGAEPRTPRQEATTRHSHRSTTRIQVTHGPSRKVTLAWRDISPGDWRARALFNPN